MLGLSAAPSGAQLSAQPPATVELGVALPLAGDDGAAGLEARSAIELALDEHNAFLPPGAPELEAVVRDMSLHLGNPHQDEGTDNAAEPERAATLMREFASEGNVAAVLGGLRQNVAAAQAPLAQALRLPLLTIAPLPLPCGPPVPAVTPHAFTFGGGVSLEALATARSLDAHGQRFAVLDDGEQARGLVAGCLSADLQAAGGRVVLRSSLRDGDDAAPARLRAEERRDGVDAVVYVAPAERGTLVCSRAAAETVQNAETLAAMKHRGYDRASVPAGCRWVVRVLPPPTTAYAGFVQRYRKRFLEAPSVEATLAFATAQVLAQAVDEAFATSPGQLRDAVGLRLARGSFETILGTVRFGLDGAATTAWFESGPAGAPLPASLRPS